ncbi:MAG: alternate F1F0 ATPase, F1 subunit alpha [Planctomycetota bacterium]|nr:MAG: alternate F1F0 ATPase, F1 subunit alpha [Planctomycetota bacterium]REJ89715.1 MAG: alternate F1F0 ATPase, F1 subunit alpha [Planctomycetota bacterium]REK26649.1 MAG: alternate F1F0 ATPase, F1 subunit alpha [Planctomycetota bacterium]REK47331.1 MAG: alternate F1F0 ATPase, F1 subunit alpha [Planctomycetota bacterium]
MERRDGQLRDVLDETFDLVHRVVESHQAALVPEEVGRVRFVGQGTARVEGLPGVRSNELVRFPGDQLGMAFNLDPGEVGVILLDKGKGLRAGSEVRRTQRVLDVPVGEALLGRVVDGVGRPKDGLSSIHAARRLPIERPAVPIMDRAPVTIPLQTGIKVIDALIPVGRGQRELILGDRQTGKTSIALDTIINQYDKDVVCVYCAIGQRGSSVARVIEDLNQHKARHYCVVVVTTEDDPPGEQFVAPYAAMSIAEHFMHRGRDVLVILDDLTKHARAYRELSLLLRRPPGREAFPGDIFYIHSRLLERSTHLRDELGGGSLTAMPIVETEAQNLSAYIPTNLISITDGQIYLSPDLFDKGVLPAVDVGKSVSRVGGKTQLPAFRDVAGDLRLSYAQFEELETFARFGTRLDEETRNTLERGRRVREILKQPQYEPLPVAEQISVLVAVSGGVFDPASLTQVRNMEQMICRAMSRRLPDVSEGIEAGEKLSAEDREAILRMALEACKADPLATTAG